MDKMVEYVIGGAIALVFLFALTPVVIDHYQSAKDSTSQSEIQAALLLTLIVFFLAVAWKVYKSV